MTSEFRTVHQSTVSSVNVSGGSASSTVSSVNVSGGHAVISVNGRVWSMDAEDAVSVRVVSDGSDSYIEITDKHGGTRRVNCEE
jgi:hypothetical protein